MDEQFVHEDQMRNARTQGVGSMVSEQNRQNALELMRKMHKIDTQNAAAKARIENNLDKALQCVDNVRDFVGSPEHILGNPKTKHGEIAENVDVWFHNADQIMHNQKADATFEGVGRTVAADYKVHGVDVQSKYINGANNSLSHVLKHMKDYKGNYEAFGKDGYYVIPKDQYEQIKKILSDDADAQVTNLEDALDDLEDNAKRKILSCIITYMYLYDHTAESMEQDEQEDFIDLFDLGRKTIKSLKQQTVDTYRLRGVDGCIDRYITAPIEITEETPFEVELPEQKTAEGASEAQTEENGEEAIDTNAPREKLVLSGSIQNDGETIYKDKDIHFSSAIMNCKGTVRFINCTIHYNEDESRIYLSSGTALEIASSTVICHGNCKSGGYFIRTVEDSVGNAVKSRTAGSCTVKNSDFVACVGFLKGSYESFLFDKNKVIGSCSDFLYLSIENKARISGSRFFLPDKPTFEAKDENNRPGDAFIHCRGKKVLFINNVFKGEKLSENSYMEEHYIYAILGSAWLSFEDEWENGMVAYCTFQQMSRCVYNIGNVRSCVFEKCREAIKECTSEISESRFEECEKAIVDVCAKAVVSNCQFIHCKGEKLLTTRGNSQVTIQDCEFSNIRWEEREFRSYTWQSMIVIGLAEKNFANADRPSRINRCIFNGICIVPNEPGKVQKKENSAYLIAVNIENYAKFKYPRAEVTDCTFVNCAAEHAVINKEPYDSVFGSSHNYTAIRAYTRNNTGLDQIGNPATFAESQNVKRKETDAASRKIGDSLPVE